MDYEHLRNKLVEDYSDLSGRLQQITRYAMTHPNDMALETIAVLAKRTEVPPSSLIRFAKSFGFSGFSEMQKVFQQGLLGRMSEYQKRVQNLNLEISQQEDEIQSNLGYFVQGGIQALQSLRKTVKDEDIDYLNQIVRDGLVELYEETADPSLKDIKDWQFKISKNHNGNLYLYSDDSLQSPYLSSQFYQEIFLTTHNDKLFIAISICVEKCNGSTDFLNIIKPSNLYVKSNPNIDASSSSDLTKQLKTLNELYKSGALTKEEFTKAKKKLLN